MNLNKYNSNKSNLPRPVLNMNLLNNLHNHIDTTLEVPMVKKATTTQPVVYSKHSLPANKEWYSNIYSYNKHNLILAPKISEWTYNISKSYLNASPKKNKMDNIMIIKEKTEKENEFSKVYFSLKNYARNTHNSNSNKNHTEFLNSIMEKKVRNVSYAVVYLNKYLSLFRKNFKVDSDVKNRSMKYFYAQKAITTSFGLQNRISLKQNPKNRYSVLKTFLSKPEIGYSNNKTKIVISIYNKKSMFILKNIKNSFDLVKAKFKKPSSFNLDQMSKSRDVNLQIKKLKNKFIHKLYNKPITSFFIYMWNNINTTSFSALNNNTYLFNNLTISAINTNSLNKLIYGLESFKNLFYFKHTLMLYFYENYKINSNNTLPMKNILFKIFLKRTYHYIISLKYWNLDSKILADIITTKLIDRTKNVLKVLKKSITHIPYYNTIPTILKLKDQLPVVAQNKKLPNQYKLFVSNKYKKHLLLENLQHKWKIGTKLQAKGRITRRKTAQRSLKKIKYVGTLTNLLSSHIGISTSLSRGVNKSNLQYINNNKYNANGSFGLKVSISSLQTLQKWSINPV
jgi:hypothetical protein